MGKIDYQNNLNQAQLEAVFSPDGPTLIIAGAGSGKTRTLVYRVARLVENGIPPERILLLTFTRKASQEMLHRVEEMLNRSCREVAGGTFHALAYKILRIYGSAIGLKRPLTVMDRKDSEELVGKIIKAKRWDKEKDNPDKKEFLELLSRYVNKGLTLEEGLSQSFFEDGISPSKLKEVNRDYETLKRQHGLLDYDDLLSHCLLLFRQETGIVQKLSSFYQYVLVDEYQDTNLLQAEMVRYLARGNIMVVGDDSQSIYGFRGAHFKNILDFPHQFPGTRVIKMEENFRSSQPILNLANRMISYSKERYSKCLFSRFKKGEPPCCIELPYEESQSQYVTRQLQEFHGQGIPWGEMAVLFRAGHHSFNLEVFLQKEGIPFKKYGGRRFVEGAHIKDFLSYLKVIHNPLDVLAWERILKLLEGFGSKRAQDIVGQITVSPDWASRLECLTGYPRLKSQLDEFSALFQRLIDQPLMTPTQALETIWEYYKNLLPGLYEEPQRRQKEIEEIIRVSYNYTETEALLGDLSLEVYEEPDGREKDQLTLSTVHSAKGLEWKVVFIIWLTEGRFPSSQSMMNPEEMEEERRLLYVAITRAKERLFLTYPESLSNRGGGWQKNDLCHFIADIPEDLLLRKGRPVANPSPRIASSYVSPIPKEEDDGFSKGTKVFHPLFGSGVIQEPPKERKVRVLFKRYGSKVLHLDYARLERGRLDMAGRPFERLSYDREYDQGLSYLYNLQKFGIKFGLSKTENLLRAFNNPHRKLNCLHIGGSNGKGSVAAMLASIYSGAGYKVGLFTSPHLVDFRERFQINGRLISKAQTLGLIQEIKEKTLEEEPPTFFEFVTAMALIFFSREKVDLAIMEVGLGGRLDATNIIKPLITVITNISLEHQDYLGKTLEDIAREKGGIIKSGVPLITGVGQKKVQNQIEKICRERQAPMFLAGRDFRTRKLGPGTFSYFGLRRSDFGLNRDQKRGTRKKDFSSPSAIRQPPLKGLLSGLIGDHQIKNAGLALTAVDLLREKYPVPVEKIRDGLSRVNWPGRMEVVSERPLIVLDGAHNPGAMRTLAETLPRSFSYKKIWLVFGMMKDKNLKQTLDYITPLANGIFLTRAEYDRSADPEDLKKFLVGKKPAPRILPTIPQAITQAMREAGPEDLILITGSLFVVGEALAWWGESRRSSK